MNNREQQATANPAAPAALRICVDCGDLAQGACQTCARIEAEADETALALVRLGIHEPLWPRHDGSPVFARRRALTEDKLRRLWEEQQAPLSAAGCPRNAAARECRTIGCGRRAVEGEFCPDCAATIVTLRAWRAKRAARRPWVSNFLYGAAVLAVEWYLLWQFRGFFYGCFQLWFGGK